MADEDNLDNEENLNEEAPAEEGLDEELEEELEEPEESKPPKEKCPECPAMAPAWMATFADMATLLMAFFVLILSFVEMETPSIFKEVSGSMSNVFGVQREVPSVEPPMGQNIIAQNFRTSKVEPSLIVNVQEETTDLEPEEKELKVNSNSGDFDVNADEEILRKALANELSKGQVEIVVQNDSLVVVAKEDSLRPDVNSADSGERDTGEIPTELLELYAKVAEAQSMVESEVFVASDSNELRNQRENNKRKDQQIEDQLRKVRANLKSQIDQGLANVERVGDQILVQLSTQNSFRSGFAELRTDFLPTLSAVGQSITDLNSKVTVSGHTDSIPIAFSERFLSNWDLSAARAAAVADFFLNSNAVADSRIDVIGFADTKPVASNDTPEGRSQNRRIEILIDS
ncbi:MAG TPA: flagellar motor protein MotB [Gammaproteobacteria bacterium]|nr:flagellar motor protein MotB [Gammaproteobacteria bacterium]